jgi:RND superfamily putative drug exporter
MQKFGRFVIARPRSILAAALLALIIIVSLGFVVLGPSYSASIELPNSPSAKGFKVLSENFPNTSSGLSGSIVFKSDSSVMDENIVSTMTDLFEKVGTLEGVSIRSPYDPTSFGQISQDKSTAFAVVNLDASLDQREAALVGDEIKSMLPDTPGLKIEVGGSALASFHPPSSEALGVAFAMVVLILTFGSVLAMGLSVFNAVFGVALGAGFVAILSNLAQVPDAALTLGAMLGIAVGIDYAIFIITRVNEFRSSGLSLNESVIKALDTAGRAVLFAGITVVLSLLGMVLVGLGFITGLAIGASASVLFSMIASLTLLPACLVLAKDRLNLSKFRGVVSSIFFAVSLVGVAFKSKEVALIAIVGVLVLLVGGRVGFLKKEVPSRRQLPLEDTRAYKWSRSVQARPVLCLTASLLVLLTLALPAASLRLGFSDEGNYPENSTTKKAYEMISDGFGPGFSGPLLVVGTNIPPKKDLMEFSASIAGLGNVAFVSPPTPNSLENPSTFVIQVIPSASPQSEETENLVYTLRSLTDSLPDSFNDVYITGATAGSIDFTDYLANRLPVFILSVLLVSFLLLVMVFRSILVPLKAVLMNLLSIGASYGVVVAIFQWGWLGSLFGVSKAPVEPFIPMMMFAILFGLSMDYEVFLLSRIKEEYSISKDPKGSVADGLAATAKVITAAAAIMVVVFAGFLFDDARIIKLFGVGLSVAVLLDATLVRMLLVPSTMELLGAKNWWLPRWLDRILPSLNIENSQHPEKEFEKIQ